MRIVRSFTVGAAIDHRQAVKLTADRTIAPATTATDDVIGVTDCPGGAAAGGRADVVLFGVAGLKAGGAIARGADIVAGAAGVGVAAAPAAGANVRTVGRAVFDAASAAGDIIEILVNPAKIQG